MLKGGSVGDGGEVGRVEEMNGERIGLRIGEIQERGLKSNEAEKRSKEKEDE